MWIFTKIGFFSTVEHRNDPNTVLVRARDRGDIERFAEKARRRWRNDPNHRSYELEIHEDVGTDYKYRIFIPKWVYRKVLAEIATEIDYPNFKNEISRVQGHERAHLYSRVWSVMHSLQEFARRFVSGVTREEFEAQYEPDQ